MLTTQEIQALSLRPVGEPGDNLRKPRPAHHKDKFFQRLEQHVHTPGVKELDLVLSHKANGWSGCLTHRAGDMLTLEYRTEDGGQMMEFPNRGRYLHERHAGMKLHVEACAFLHGVREMGHYFVARAMEAFVRNGHRNVPGEPIHLRLRIFALHSVPWQGRERTPRKPAITGFLQTLPVQDNNLVDVVPHEIFHLVKVGGGVRYNDSRNRFICTDYTDFYQEMLVRAGENEGWVLQVSEGVFGEEVVYKDTFEGYRHAASLKVKMEPEVTCLAAKIENQTERSMDERSLIYVYCKRGDSLVYAGDASDNQAIRARLDTKTAALVYRNAEERKRMYSLKLEDFRGSAVQLRVRVASITPGGYLSGIKQYGISRPSWISLDEISNLQKLAAEFPHFVAMKQVRADYERVARDQIEDNPFDAQRKRKAKPPPPVASTPPPRPASPPRKHSPEPPACAPPLPAAPIRPAVPMPARSHPRIQYRPRQQAPVPQPLIPAPQPPSPPPPPASSIVQPPVPEPTAPTPAKKPWTTVEEQENEAWEEYKTALLQPVRKQEIFYYREGRKIQYNGVIPAVKLPGSLNMVFEGTGGVAWPVKVSWPVEEPQGGVFRWQELHVGEPPALFERWAYRTPAKPISVYLNESFAKDDLLRHRIEFFGGRAVYKKGPDVDVVISPKMSLALFEKGDTLNCCAWDREEMPNVRFATVETIQAVLRV
jgi:hypothetical protein